LSGALKLPALSPSPASRLPANSHTAQYDVEEHTESLSTRLMFSLCVAGTASAQCPPFAPRRSCVRPALGNSFHLRRRCRASADLPFRSRPHGLRGQPRPEGHVASIPPIGAVGVDDLRVWILTLTQVRHKLNQSFLPENVQPGPEVLCWLFAVGPVSFSCLGPPHVKFVGREGPDPVDSLLPYQGSREFLSKNSFE